MRHRPSGQSSLENIEPATYLLVQKVKQESPDFFVVAFYDHIPTQMKQRHEILTHNIDGIQNVCYQLFHTHILQFVVRLLQLMHEKSQNVGLKPIASILLKQTPHPAVSKTNLLKKNLQQIIL